MKSCGQYSTGSHSCPESQLLWQPLELKGIEEQLSLLALDTSCTSKVWSNHLPKHHIAQTDQQAGSHQDTLCMHYTRAHVQDGSGDVRQPRETPVGCCHLKKETMWLKEMQTVLNGTSVCFHAKALYRIWVWGGFRL